MVKLNPAIESLRACELNFRKAISEAAREARPAELSVLVGWLQDIQRILAEAKSQSGMRTAVESRAGPNVPVRIPPPDNKQTVSGTMRLLPAASKASRHSSKTYPMFFGERDNLVKVGWSKKAREEYEHKAPKRTVFALTAALAEAGRNGRRFTMESVMPIKEPDSETAVPDYQAYLALAWLRALGLVVQHGRQGYTLTNVGLQGELLEHHWSGLPASISQ